MSNNVCLLVACLYSEDELLWCALKIDGNEFADDYYMEPENRKIIFNHLPANCKYPIVEVREIFAIKEG